tara:strand:- start:11 stop:418 length:408 start_codon:yes stop_codon:yes gene_type:complete
MKFEHIFSELKNKIEEIDGFELNSHNLIKVLRITIEIVEVVSLPGNEKKLLVIDLVKKFVNDSKIDNKEKEICLELINNGTLGETIDLVVDASNGNLDINNIIDLGSSCCAILLKRLLEKKDKRKKKKKRAKLKF